MIKGTITQLIDRGFGFIKTEDGKELFFHRSEIAGVEFSRLRVGQEVEFEMGQDKKGRSAAVKVTLIEAKAPEPPPSQ
jgi:CspA family cold shock protein